MAIVTIIQNYFGVRTQTPKHFVSLNRLYPGMSISKS